ncbi:hypothetical protein ACNKHL_13545 [Shigella flexneri]
MVRRSDIGNDGPYAIFERHVRFAGIHGTMRSKEAPSETTTLPTDIAGA